MKKGKLYALEGLRGVAALIVVIGHLRAIAFVGSDKRFEDLFLWITPEVRFIFIALFEAFFDGNFAVWLFWTMSGFVLSLRYFSLRNNGELKTANQYIGGAFFRRYFRLFIPIFASVMFAYILHQMNLMYNDDVVQLYENGSHKWLSSFYVFSPNFFNAIKSAVWDTFFSYNPHTTYNAVLWTIKAELFGAFFLYIFLFFVGNQKWRFICYAICMIAITKVGIHWLNAFLIGMLLCDLYTLKAAFLEKISENNLKKISRIQKSALLTTGIVLVMLVLIGLPNHGGILHLWLSIVAIVFLFIFKPLQRFFEHPVNVFLGKISFGLYLVHLPIICSFTSYAYLAWHGFMGEIFAKVVVISLTLILSLGGGYLFFLYFDKPSQRISYMILEKALALVRKTKNLKAALIRPFS